MARGQYDFKYVPQAVLNPEGFWNSAGVNTAYSNLEFSVPDVTTHYNVSTSVAGAFDIITIARAVNIRTDATITVKFNSTANDAITITSTEGTFRFDTLEVTNIFITNNSGGAANVKIFLT